MYLFNKPTTICQHWNQLDDYCPFDMMTNQKTKLPAGIDYSSESTNQRNSISKPYLILRKSYPEAQSKHLRHACQRLVPDDLLSKYSDAQLTSSDFNKERTSTIQPKYISSIQSKSNLQIVYKNYCMDGFGGLYGGLNNLKYKTQLCRKYLAYGKCPYAEMCSFAHGESELRHVNVIGVQYAAKHHQIVFLFFLYIK